MQYENAMIGFVKYSLRTHMRKLLMLPRERGQGLFLRKGDFGLGYLDEQLGNMEDHQKNVVGKRKNTGKGPKA